MHKTKDLVAQPSTPPKTDKHTWLPATVSHKPLILEAKGLCIVNIIASRSSHKDHLLPKAEVKINKGVKIIIKNWGIYDSN